MMEMDVFLFSSLCPISVDGNELSNRRNLLFLLVSAFSLSLVVCLGKIFRLALN